MTSIKPGRGLAAAALLVSLALVPACDTASTGAAVGDPCATPGSTTECEADAVCDSDSKLGTVCLAQCEKDDDCASDEKCSGTTGSLKGCHPQ